MGHRCCSKQKVKKGLWSPEEDEKLLKHITTHGHGSWSSVPKLAGLQRCGKSCRLRWINYLRPDVRRGSFTEEEEQIIIDVHRILGNRWAQIAKHLPGRTDNEVKNYWNSCIKKKLMSKGLDPNTHVLMPSHQRAAASNKIACNIQQPISTPAFAMNSSQLLPMSNIVSMEIIRPPVLTLPAPTDQSSLLQPTAIPMPPASEYQNPNFVWNACDQNSQDHSTNFPNYVSSSIDHLQNGPTSSPSCSSLMNPTGFGLTDENYCVWDTSTNVGHLFEVPSLEAKPQQQRGKENNICDHQAPQTDKVDDEANMDCSFDSSSFDHHLDFVDSALMAGVVCRDLSSISTDDFAWNFS